MKEKAVFFLFDIQGTLEMMTEEDIQLLFFRMQQIKNIYGSNKIIISVSTHSRFTNDIQKILDQFEKYCGKNVILGKNFYLEGIYNPMDKSENYMNSRYNSDKEERFVEYVNELREQYDLQLCSFIDDSANISKLENLRGQLPFVCLRPSQRDNKEDSLICFSTGTRNIKGVNELLESYVHLLARTDWQSLFEQQKEQLPKLSSERLQKLFFQLDLDTIGKYLLQGNIEKNKLDRIVRDMRSLLEMTPEMLKTYTDYNKENGYVAFNWENISDLQKQKIQQIINIASLLSNSYVNGKQPDQISNNGGLIERTNEINGTLIKAEATNDKFVLFLTNDNEKVLISVRPNKDTDMKYTKLEEFLNKLIHENPSTPITDLYSLFAESFGEQENYSSVWISYRKKGKEDKTYEKNTLGFEEGNLKMFLMTNGDFMYISDDTEVWKKKLAEDDIFTKETTEVSQEDVPPEIREYKKILLPKKSYNF